MKATQLDVIIEKLNACSEHNKKARKQLQLQMQLSEQLKKSVCEAEERMRLCKSVQTLRDDIKQLKCEQQWIGVVEQEQFMQDIKETLDRSIEKQRKTREKIQKLSSSEKELQSKCVALQTEISELSGSISSEEKTLTTFRNEFKSKNEEFLNEARALKTLEVRKLRTETDIQRLKQHTDDQLNR